MANIEPQGRGVSADEAIQRLIDGNERSLRAETRSRRYQKPSLMHLAKEQKSYATILGCSVPQVPSE